jgi:outer membrane autotransporter protein
MSDDGIKVGGTSVPGATFEVDNVVGIYVKGKTRLTDNLEAFARAGLARAKGTASLDGQSASASESGFSYGVGLSYAFDKTTSLNIDYMSYLDKNSSKATGITVGLGFKF